MHLTSNPAIWYAARASGIAAYVVLTVTVSVGLALGGKAQRLRWPRFAVEDVHRFGGLLVGWLIFVHVGAIAADSFLPFSVQQLVVPFLASYRPLWTGLGVFAAELLLALALTNRHRRRLPHRLWRRAHYANFAVWTAASLHGVFGGTDRSAPWLAVLYGVAISTVGLLVLWRVGRVWLRPRSLATAGIVGLVGLPLLLLGPLQKSPQPWNPARFTEPLSGQVVRSGTSVREIVSFVGAASAPQKLLVRADLLVSPSTLDATSLQLEYLPSGQVCRGRVARVGLTSFTGRCRLAGGGSRWIGASWSSADDSSAVAGTIRLHA